MHFLWLQVGWIHLHGLRESMIKSGLTASQSLDVLNGARAGLVLCTLCITIPHARPRPALWAEGRLRRETCRWQN
jgi:hypothetical protein